MLIKNKLFISTALIGVSLGAQNLLAETKISGSADFTYSSINGTSKANNTQGAGKEVQIDISKTTNLDNGLGFSAGFSLEQDGSESSFDGSAGNFMEFSSGNTSIKWNIDAAASLSASAVPTASTDIETMVSGMSTTSFDWSPGGQNQFTSWNIELAQKLDESGTVYLVYVPRINDAGGNNDNIDGSSDGTQLDFIYSGNAGIDGLNLQIGYSKADAPSSTLQDQKVTQLGAAYNFGKFAIGYQQAEIDQADSTEDKQKEYGLTYSVNDNLTFGFVAATTDDNSAENEEIRAVQLGYNLGPVTFEAYAIEIQNLAGSATAANEEKLGLRLTTQF